jgi:hypothetical protein
LQRAYFPGRQLLAADRSRHLCRDALEFTRRRRESSPCVERLHDGGVSYRSSRATKSVFAAEYSKLENRYLAHGVVFALAC